MESITSGPAYRIETERLVIRCYDPQDAILLEKAIKNSLEHLKPWMPWAHNEPEPLEDKVNRIRSFRAKFDLDKEFVYGIFDQEETTLIGGCGLHSRGGPESLEIGYWINVSYINQGYCTEATLALTKVAFEIHNMKKVEIHCDPRNIASAAIPKKLGYTHEATIRKSHYDEQQNLRDAMIWGILKDEYCENPIYHSKIQAFNVLGNRIPMQL
jgi:RimJ/RimL family protein N-acetyltransferase